jgi:hypothetical protein
MTTPRNYRVIRGQRGDAARDKYLAYLKGLSLPDLTNTPIKDRPAKVVLYVTPFGLKLGPDVLLQTSALTTSFNELKAIVGTNHVIDVLPGTKSAVKIRNAKAARVSATRKSPDAAVRKKSTRTGLWYIHYAGSSHSIPFGAAAAADRQGDVFESFVTALKAGYKSYHLIEERI